jgi:hypothetical protein
LADLIAAADDHPEIAPDVLIVGLNRLVHGEGHGPDGHRLENEVEAPLDDLHVGGKRYRLHAVINGVARSALGGHFDATVFDEVGGQWINYDDDARKSQGLPDLSEEEKVAQGYIEPVKVIQPEEVVSARAMGFFYLAVNF